MQEVGRKTEGLGGLTLIELTISVTIIGLIGSVIAGLLFTGLNAYRSGLAQVELQREAAYAMNRMVEYTRNARFVFLPNAVRYDLELLAVSAGIDTDDDGRIDEDSTDDLTGDGQPGLAGIDDDDDGSVDEGNMFDDDEDGAMDEDPFDGLDNDEDGLVDEDPDGNWNGLPVSGIADFDDDGDGQVDESPLTDDDEDGLVGEDPAEPIVFTLEGDTLLEVHPVHGANALAHSVTQFRAQYLLGAEGEPYINIILTLSRGPGSELVLKRQIHNENILQKQGMSS
jgi:hypothetical protein